MYKKENLRILVVTSTFPRWEGDVEPKFVFDLCLHLKQIGFDIDILAPHTNGAMPHEIMNGMQVYRYYYCISRWEKLAYSGGILANLKRNKFLYYIVPLFLLFQLFAVLRQLRKKRYDVIIDVALELRSFADNFFNLVNQGRAGTFWGREEGYKKLSDIVEKAHFNTSEGFIQFTEELIDNLKHDKRSSESSIVDVNSQLRKGIELNQLYDYIYHAEFLQPFYNLKLGNKSLQELSPGERGALLLIFYLILDNDDIPLIIDQPEENLDNESVYNILVYFIKKVKEKRLSTRK